VSKRIFITGAAGLIGGEIASRLSEQGHSVTGLVHRNHELRNNNDLILATRDWSAGGHSAGSVLTISGDVSKPRFGWDEAQWSAFADPFGGDCAL
jgi:2-alkyl-3-oxoalkanoate reductase